MSTSSLESEKEKGYDALVKDENCGYLIPDENCGYLNPVIQDIGKSIISGLTLNKKFGLRLLECYDVYFKLPFQANA